VQPPKVASVPCSGKVIPIFRRMQRPTYPSASCAASDFMYCVVLWHPSQDYSAGSLQYECPPLLLR
jgi:hypothetical protein